MYTTVSNTNHVALLINMWLFNHEVHKINQSYYTELRQTFKIYIYNEIWSYVSKLYRDETLVCNTLF